MLMCTRGVLRVVTKQDSKGCRCVTYFAAVVSCVGSKKGIRIAVQFGGEVRRDSKECRCVTYFAAVLSCFESKKGIRIAVEFGGEVRRDSKECGVLIAVRGFGAMAHAYNQAQARTCKHLKAKVLTRRILR